MTTVETADLSTRRSKPKNGRPAPVRCTARRTNGEPCKRYAVHGATVCRSHGGAAPQVQAAARRRLQQATDALAARLLGIALDEGTSESVRLAAIRDALDRGGVTAKAELELSAKQAEPPAPWQQIVGVARISAEESRARRGVPDDSPPTPALPPADDGTVIDAEVVPDPAQDSPAQPPTRPAAPMAADTPAEIPGDSGARKTTPRRRPSKALARVDGEAEYAERHRAAVAAMHDERDTARRNRF